MRERARKRNRKKSAKVRGIGLFITYQCRIAMAMSRCHVVGNVSHTRACVCGVIMLGVSMGACGQWPGVCGGRGATGVINQWNWRDVVM